MADTLVEGSPFANTNEARTPWGPYWSDDSIGVIVLVDSGQDISYSRTDDGGATWATTEIDDGRTTSVACWFDKETPGDTGTLLHIAWIDDQGDDVNYRNLDIATDTLGTQRLVDTGITVANAPNSHEIAITKCVNGQLILAFKTETEVECYKSSDLFATAGTDIADVFEDIGEADHALLFPANVADGDAVAIFHDLSAGELSIKMWDDSVGDWTETSIATSIVGVASRISFDGAVQHSDNHIFLASHIEEDTTGDDILTWDLTVDNIDTPTITAKTNMVTNVAESGQVAVFIDQNTDAVYVAYLKGGTWLATVDVVFHISTDGMGIWGSEQAYSEQTADDFRSVQAGRTVGTAGGRYQPSWFDDDDVDIFVNLVNDIEFASPSGGSGHVHRLLMGVG